MSGWGMYYLGMNYPMRFVLFGFVHDVSQLDAVLKWRAVSPLMENEEEHLSADAAFVGDRPREKMIAAGYTPHVRSRGEEKFEKVAIPGFKARRWVVEACHSWRNRFRKLTIRYEKRDDTHIALTTWLRLSLR